MEIISLRIECMCFKSVLYQICKRGDVLKLPKGASVRAPVPPRVLTRCAPPPVTVSCGFGAAVGRIGAEGPHRHGDMSAV